MSQKTVAQLAAEIAAQLPTNGANLITAADVRGVLGDMVDSSPNIADGEMNPAYVTLTDGATVTWTLNPRISEQNAKLTIAGNRTLAFSGLVTGMHGTLTLIQTAGGNILTLPATSVVQGGGTLNPLAAGVDLLKWWYDGTRINWYYGRMPAGWTSASNAIVGQGSYDFVGGSDITVFGSGSGAFGSRCVTVGSGFANAADDSVAIGYAAGAAAVKSTIIGAGTQGGNVGCLVLGYRASPAGDYSFAIGSAANKLGKSNGTGVETTVGPAGAASVLPIAPTAYMRMRINDTEYKVPLYTP